MREREDEMIEMCSTKDSREALKRKSFIGQWKAPHGLVARARIFGLLQSRKVCYRETKDAAEPVRLPDEKTETVLP